MKLCAEEKGVLVPRNTTFVGYYDLLPELKDKAQMERLNAQRVGLKHHGQLPSSLDVEISRVNVTEFFNHNVPVFFACKLEDVSLEVMIIFPSVRGYLDKYHDFVSRGKFGSAQAMCQIAFKEFLTCYHDKYHRSLLLHNSPGINARWLGKPDFHTEIDLYLDDLKEDVLKINQGHTLCR